VQVGPKILRLQSTCISDLICFFQSTLWTSWLYHILSTDFASQCVSSSVWQWHLIYACWRNAWWERFYMYSFFKIIYIFYLNGTCRKITFVYNDSHHSSTRIGWSHLYTTTVITHPQGLVARLPTYTKSTDAQVP
jgi:hypothetical protein